MRCNVTQRKLVKPTRKSYTLICEGPCSHDSAQAAVARVQERLEKHAWDFHGEGQSMTLALQQMATTPHRTLTEQHAQCLVCGHQRQYGRVLWMKPWKELVLADLVRKAGEDDDALEA